MIWAVLSPTKLSQRARESIADPANTVLVSVIGTWEISIKAFLGRLQLPEAAPRRIRQACEEADFRVLQITIDHAEEVRGLPWHHRDPFDRMLVTQARTEKCHLVTRDRALRAYPVAVLW